MSPFERAAVQAEFAKVTRADIGRPPFADTREQHIEGRPVIVQYGDIRDDRLDAILKNAPVTPQFHHTIKCTECGKPATYMAKSNNDVILSRCDDHLEGVDFRRASGIAMKPLDTVEGPIAADGFAGDPYDQV